ncbi:MAG: 50S ribosomal protein L4 [Candidatus Pacearchaeota archaeon]|nr:50S ribosomal protein L4 [Nanoarchaeota archaeon]MDZ4226786.1 50S ribosomal protein L4 [Candidatus Pacearchaeota archaeon]
MKAEILDIEGKKTKEIELPLFFSYPIREDVISKVLEAKKTMQPYSPSPVAGKQHAASGKIVHRRHVWRSGYGRGQSRIPRKIMTRKGSQFNWVGAEVSATRGGRRAHPPKIISMENTRKINKKEARAALVSALSATADKKQVSLRYKRIEAKDLKELPIVVESKLVSLKTKHLVESLKKILGEKIFAVSLSKKEVRSGKGKLRGRKYKSNAGALIVLGKKEKLKANVLDSKTIDSLSVTDLAEGGPGRLTIYTEQAIKDLKDKFEGLKK